MKKMTTAKKISSNRLTAKRTRKDLKRRSHVKALIMAYRKSNLQDRQLANRSYFRAKHMNRAQTPQKGLLL